MLPTTVTFFGLSIHLYGVIIGIALLVALSIIEKKYTELHLPAKFFNWLVVAALIGGVLGARIWHVATDFAAYADNLVATVYIWQGGLSIFGALTGGLLGLWLALILLRKYTTAKITLTQVLDLVALGLPAGQAIGRFANYVNQELYGLPTAGWWGIYIEPTRRLPEYSTISHYHPLFFYEAIATGLFAVGVWVFSRLHKLPKIGSGVLFMTYVLFYSVVRFFLDFLRLQKPPVLGALGINQVVLAAVLVGITGFLVWRERKASRYSFTAYLSFIAVVIVSMGFVYGASQKDPISQQKASVVRQLRSHFIDGEKIAMTIAGKSFLVEVANTPASITQGLSDRTEIGSDGMLFIFPERMQTKFWMRNMRFDLDIIWIDAGKIVGIDQNVPKPDLGVDLEQLLIYSSKQPVEMVLELPAGAASQKGLAIGQDSAFFIDK